MFHFEQHGEGRVSKGWVLSDAGQNAENKQEEKKKKKKKQNSEINHCGECLGTGSVRLSAVAAVPASYQSLAVP